MYNVQTFDSESESVVRKTEESAGEQHVKTPVAALQDEAETCQGNRCDT